jgi:hypothetical protein
VKQDPSFITVPIVPVADHRGEFRATFAIKVTPNSC